MTQDELPPLPQHYALSTSLNEHGELCCLLTGKDTGLKERLFTAEQMRAYALAAATGAQARNDEGPAAGAFSAAGRPDCTTPWKEASSVAEQATGAQAAIPEGYALVPTRPTQEMCMAMQQKLREWPRYPFRVSPVYQAALAAAPK